MSTPTPSGTGATRSGSPPDPTPRDESVSSILMAREFNEHPNSNGPEGTRNLMWTLVQEEADELIYELAMAADGNPRPAGIARELADVVYLAYTAAWAYGIDLDAALREVHRANMTKMEAGVRRPDGKIVKHPGFVAPDMTEAVRHA